MSDATHPFLRAILNYVEGGTIITDLLQAGVLVLDSKGKYDEKQLVRWRVNGVEGEEPACWKNQKLFSAFVDYYLKRIANRPALLCMVEGTKVPPAVQHPKGIIPVNGNAKLISANDSSGFTYRGRFTEKIRRLRLAMSHPRRRIVHFDGLHRSRACGSLWVIASSCAGTHRGSGC